MKSRIPSLLPITIVVLAIAALASTAESSRLDRLSWILGSWTMTTGETTTVEEWTRVNPRILEGRGWAQHAGGERQLGEEILLAELGGEIFYIPKVTENAYPVPFRLTSLEGERVVFENPSHDFPRRITYQRSDSNTMLVTLAGPSPDGSEKQIDFRFERAGTEPNTAAPGAVIRK